MKKLILIALLGAAAYAFFNKPGMSLTRQAPSYAEMRVQMETASRQIDVVMFARMAGEAECRERTDKVWRKVLADCPTCTFKVVACSPELIPRYAKLFADVPTHVTYASLTAGSAQERDGRLIFWGVTLEESDKLCDLVVPKLKQRYSGKAECVRHRAS